MRKRLIAIAALQMMSMILGQSVMACTDFQIKAKDGAVVSGRSLEWGIDMKSRLRIHPRQEKCQSETENGKPGLSWQSKYGYVGADCYGLNVCIDGINEKGLSASGLWFPDAEYPKDITHRDNMTINVVDVCSWILGNFDSVDQVKSAFIQVHVWGKGMSELSGAIPTMHFAVHDTQGRSAVVEFANGHLKVYDNPNTVLTNAPSFDWHLTNLRNYLSISPSNPNSIKIGGAVFAPPGQGSGFLGIPGDWTPSSRFVRTMAMLRFAKPVTDASGAVNLAEHILNAVDIPLGAVRPASGDISESDYTQWIVIKDLTNKILYYRSYENLGLKSIDLKKVDMSPGSQSKPVYINQK